jgi:hypothetical protein
MSQCDVSYDFLHYCQSIMYYCYFLQLLKLPHIVYLSSVVLHITSDDQLFLFFLMFSYIYVNVKFNLNKYTFHQHENTHVNLFFYIHVGG